MAKKGTPLLPLSGIKVLEIAGLAPAPYCGLILADFGADVIRIDRVGISTTTDTLSRGKRSISINFKSKDGIKCFKRLASKSDVIIDPFRPGVLEKLGLNPVDLCQENEGLIIARLTGFGQTGPLRNVAGHDVNYLAVSGSLGVSSSSKPSFHANILADFAAGGAFCAMGILLAIIERSKSGKGQVIDAAMIDGCNYLNSFIYANKDKFFPLPRTQNLLDGGAPFYDIYKTKDDKFITFAALEPQFYEIFLNVLNISDEKLSAAARFDPSNWPYLRQRYEEIFASKTQAEWSELFQHTDACIQPVVEISDFPSFYNTVERNMMFKQPSENDTEIDMPMPAPRFSRSSNEISKNLTTKKLPNCGEHTFSVLIEFGFSVHEARILRDINAVEFSDNQIPSSKL